MKAAGNISLAESKHYEYVMIGNNDCARGTLYAFSKLLSIKNVNVSLNMHCVEQ